MNAKKSGEPKVTRPWTVVLVTDNGMQSKLSDKAFSVALSNPIPISFMPMIMVYMLSENIDEKLNYTTTRL